MTTDKPADVRFPEMRHEVQYAIRALSDPAYQQRVWRHHDLPTPDYEYDFDMAINALYDDTELADHPQSTVGAILRGNEELEAILAVMQKLDLVLREIGRDESFEAAQELGIWPDIVQAAKKARNVLGDPPRFP
jgi:hypothetical protein